MYENDMLIFHKEPNLIAGGWELGAEQKRGKCVEYAFKRTTPNAHNAVET
jgi:hypothetical protein